MRNTVQLKQVLTDDSNSFIIEKFYNPISSTVNVLQFIFSIMANIFTGFSCFNCFVIILSFLRFSRLGALLFNAGYDEQVFSAGYDEQVFSKP